MVLLNFSSDKVKDVFVVLYICIPLNDTIVVSTAVSFGQQHQIQQVYLRSTARVYEIYYSTDRKSNNEYLCTVKCSAAANEDGSLIPCDIREANGVQPEEPLETVEVPTYKIKSNSSQSTNEDDWVDVKTPVSPFLVNSMLNKTNENTETNTQVFLVLFSASSLDMYYPLCITLCLPHL